MQEKSANAWGGGGGGGSVADNNKIDNDIKSPVVYIAFSFFLFLPIVSKSHILTNKNNKRML